MVQRLQDRAWLTARFAESVSVRAIARELGCSHSTVRRAALALDLALPPPRRFVSEITAEQLERLVDEGLTQPEMADVLGCSVPSVQRAMRRHGIALREPGRSLYPELNDREWLRRAVRDEGLSITDIARRLGAGQRTVRRALRRHHVRSRGFLAPTVPAGRNERIRRDLALFGDVRRVARLNRVDVEAVKRMIGH